MASTSDEPRFHDIAWRDRPFQTLQTASQLLGLSTASIYRLAGEERLKLKRLVGRTLVETEGVIELLGSAEDWTPSPRTRKAKHAQLAAARAHRAELAA